MNHIFFFKVEYNHLKVFNQERNSLILLLCSYVIIFCFWVAFYSQDFIPDKRNVNLLKYPNYNNKITENLKSLGINNHIINIHTVSEDLSFDFNFKDSENFLLKGLL